MQNFDQSRVWFFQSGTADRAAGMYRTVVAQPNWLVRLTLLVFMLAVALPILALLFFAIFVAVVVFLAGAGINRIASWLKSLRPRDDGRHNVRVIGRADDAA